MKVLLAIDGSKYDRATVKELIQRPWPSGTEVRVVSVAHPIPLIREPTLGGAAAHAESLKQQQERSSNDVGKVTEEITKSVPGLKVSTQVLEGSPKKMIVEEAERWGADLIMVGSHGHGPVERFLLGSVAQAVALHASCSVEIVRLQRQ